MQCRRRKEGGWGLGGASVVWMLPPGREPLVILELPSQHLLPPLHVADFMPINKGNFPAQWVPGAAYLHGPMGKNRVTEVTRLGLNLDHLLLE